MNLRESGPIYQREQLKINPTVNAQTVWDYLIRYFDRNSEQVVITGSVEELLDNPTLFRMLMTSCDFSILQTFKDGSIETIDINHERVANNPKTR